MTTLTIEIKDKDAGFVKEFLNKIGAKVKIESDNQIALEIIQALSEVKEMQQGKRKLLSLDDI
jgi:hypothetical protein